MSNEICDKFNKYFWHDSMISSFQLIMKGYGIQDICFNLDLITDYDGYKYKKVILIFNNCVLLNCELNLKGKNICSDQISYADCLAESNLKTTYIEQLKALGTVAEEEKHNLYNIYHFKIIFIPPGGEIHILAKDFEIFEV